MPPLLLLHLVWLGVEACLPGLVVVLGSAAADSLKRKRVDLSMAQKAEIIEYIEDNNCSAEDATNWFNSKAENVAAGVSTKRFRFFDKSGSWPPELSNIRA